MSIIYEPRGKALEYSPLAANIYKGCGHACVYCYAPSATFTNRERFSSAEYISPRKNIVDALEKDAAKLNGDKRPILLSFTSDIYQPADDKFRLSRLTLLSLKRNNLVATVLTKGGTRACKDFDILKQNSKNAFSVTLTTDDDAESSKWEPGAALPADRIESLKKAHAAGIKTWVSFEPVINPDAVIRLIETTRGFVDLYKVGLLNYHPHSKTIDWIKFRLSAIETLQRYNKPYYIKKDLRDLKQRSPW